MTPTGAPEAPRRPFRRLDVRVIVMGPAVCQACREHVWFVLSNIGPGWRHADRRGRRTIDYCPVLWGLHQARVRGGIS